ncbi:copper homeostasis protein CutC [Streptomyces polyrhachis]|uniref:Copper homeostasis protein cutC homolog n=1 Tax=Streptomyces polyrhachis TaxID=1282885 RepID=A0ABW2GH76_9ACTN
MSRPVLLEVIALDARDARAAEEGGADRLELVADMAADGLTPDPAVFAAVREAVDLPVRVMLRAADGFAAGDVDALAESARELRAAGAREFVLGFLTPDGAPDLPALTALTEALDGAPWTFHRALDRAADRTKLRAALAGLPGLDTYLTAGSAQGVAHGLDTLRAEAATFPQAGDTPWPRIPRTLVGGGLKETHVPALRAAGIDAFHVGGPVRPQGWSGPVDAAAVRRWRTLVDGGS